MYLYIFAIEIFGNAVPTNYLISLRFVSSFAGTVCSSTGIDLSAFVLDVDLVLEKLIVDRLGLISSCLLVSRKK